MKSLYLVVILCGFILNAQFHKECIYVFRETQVTDRSSRFAVRRMITIPNLEITFACSLSRWILLSGTFP
jgi:hypothetical protein